MEILGYVGALFIGLVLGLTGGGGSILTVPILVYLMSINPVTATAYSLFIVGTTSTFGAIQNYRKNLVDIKNGFIFAIPSFIAVYLTRKFIVPRIPEIIVESPILITKNIFLMLFFAVIMIFGALVITLIFEIFNVIMNPANTKRTLLSTVGVVIVLVIAWSLADGTPLQIIGYEGSDNVPSMLKLTDAGVYIFYFMMLVTFVTIVITEVGRIFK